MQYKYFDNSDTLEWEDESSYFILPDFSSYADDYESIEDAIEKDEFLLNVEEDSIYSVYLERTGVIGISISAEDVYNDGDYLDHISLPMFSMLRALEYLCGTKGHITFQQFRNYNLLRQQEKNYNDKCSDWSLNDWATALTGEVGEACNLLKKVRRGDYNLDDVRSELGKELADIFTYLDILASKLELDLGTEVVKKFNEVSTRIGSNVTIPVKEIEL